MTVTYGEIHRECDWDQDAETEGFRYVRAFTTLYIPLAAGGGHRGRVVGQMIQSPGLYGIRDVGGPSDVYLAEVFQEEREILLEMLAALGAVPTGEAAPSRCPDCESPNWAGIRCYGDGHPKVAA